jgi:hypothetical protein
MSGDLVMSSSQNRAAMPRRGVALPIALAAIIAVAALISGVFFAAIQEHRVGRNSLVAQQAMNAAEVGLNSIVSSWSSRMTDTLKVGKAVVLADTTIDGATVKRDYVKVSHTTYLVTSTAIAGDQSKAMKRLQTTIRIETPDFKIMGALTGRGGDTVAGAANVNGTDVSPAGWDCPPPGPMAAGLVVGDSAINAKAMGTCQTTTKGVSTQFTCVTGDPKVKDSTALVNDLNTYTQFGGFNYDSLVSIADKQFTAEPLTGSFAAIRPSTTGTPAACNYADQYNWGAVIPSSGDPTIRGPCSDYYPIIHLKGQPADGIWSLDGGGLSGTGGQGILLVDGDLAIAGMFQWTGIILTKGSFRLTGANPNIPRITGAVMAMNTVTPTKGNFVSGDVVLQFSRCAVNQVTAKRSRAIPMKKRGWTDLSF